MPQLSSWATYEAVTVWWELPVDAAADAVYNVRVNGAECTTNRTHFTAELPAETPYHIEVSLNGALLGEVSGVTCAMPKQLNVRDFGAVGDGQTMDTAALQKAIDACEKGCEVVLPAAAQRYVALSGGRRGAPGHGRSRRLSAEDPQPL